MSVNIEIKCVDSNQSNSHEFMEVMEHLHKFSQELTEISKRIEVLEMAVYGLEAINGLNTENE